MSTLETAVEAVRDRIVVMQPLAVTDTTEATKDWVHWSQTFPFWVNRISGLSEDLTTEYLWEYRQMMRLILGTTGLQPQDTRQNLAYEYTAQTLAYFKQYPQLNPTGYAEIVYLDLDGVTVSSPRGLDIFNPPGQTFTAFYIEFELTARLLIPEDYA